ncbi:MAG: acid phosphatase, partial [Candidatus Rokuibacteriota bacterium]
MSLRRLAAIGLASVVALGIALGAAHQLKPAQAATTVPAYDHVFVIVME